MSNSPTVSVIMAVYNERPDYLKIAVDSILSQTLTDIEFLIVDDGSRPEIADALTRLAAGDVRIRLSHQPNMGLTKTLNNLARMARGKYIARQDSDDYSASNRLEVQVKYMEAHPEIMMLGTSCYVIDAKGKELVRQNVITAPKEIKRKLLRENQFIHGSVMFQREIFDREGLCYEEFRFAEDYELFLRISEGWPVANIDQPLYFYRVNPNSISVARAREQMFMGMVAQEGARLRRAGKIAAWTPEAYSAIVESLKSDSCQTELSLRLSLVEGRNNMLAGRYAEARTIFAKAFIATPSIKLLWHILRTFAGRRMLR